MNDVVSQPPEARRRRVSYEASVRYATALVQDGVTGVRLVLPRTPGLVARARAAGRAAGVAVRAEQIGSATMTLRFFSERPPREVTPSEPRGWLDVLLRILRRA